MERKVQRLMQVEKFDRDRWSVAPTLKVWSAIHINYPMSGPGVILQKNGVYLRLTG